MSKNWITGFPRIGEQRELKFALEDYWSGKSSYEKVETTAKELRKRHWQYQQKAGIEAISCNDFSLYDNMLDTSIMLGAVPDRFAALEGEELYFAMARGSKNAVAMSMTKWFNTNYHYIVPELSADDAYTLDSSKIISEYQEAKELGIKPKINLIGPITYLGLSKRVDRGDTFELIGKIVPVYQQLLREISKLDDEITVQIDEPYLSKNPSPQVLSLIKPTYEALSSAADLKIAVVTYFEHAVEAVKVLVHTPVWGIGLDFVHGEENINILDTLAQSDKYLIAGVVDGRNIWRNDLDATLQLIESISAKLPKERIIVSTSSSLLHVPYTLQYEEKLDIQIRSWLSYAVEKLDEVSLLTRLFVDGESALNPRQTQQLASNREASLDRKNAKLIHDTSVHKRINAIDKWERDLSFEERIGLQHEKLGYPVLPTTTIGSFPQTPDIRKVRREYKKGEIDHNGYTKEIRKYIDECIAFQEECGLDVLVHGEPERNDMVEYFGEQLNGFGFSANGWVQSYGSRCVKPPFIYGDISRPKPMTVEWINYAQSKTDKIVKGMLTGPVTILNWSFVRDDMPRSEVSKQIALAIQDEISDLQDAGIQIIQVDEAAFKEGYPLRDEKIPEYESWAVRDFKLAVSIAKPQTQIHTHMCYSDFNGIIHTIEAMDADVISIETSRSGNRLLKVFKEVGYKNEIGPGVYDIHSPRIPSTQEMVVQIEKLLEVLPKEQLWINPDCGLKTRKWEEVKPSLKNMVEAVRIIREK
jgi:5-methyltetrahydropteroyltriglutamate--homocysteine methyltransferase